MAFHRHPGTGRITVAQRLGDLTVIVLAVGQCTGEGLVMPVVLIRKSDRSHILWLVSAMIRECAIVWIAAWNSRLCTRYPWARTTGSVDSASASTREEIKSSSSSCASVRRSAATAAMVPSKPPNKV